MNKHTNLGIYKRVKAMGYRSGAVLAFLIGFAAAVFLLSTSDALISTDDYYHTRISAELIRQGTLRVAFPWLPLTILNLEAFVDHHLLYHIYLAPFVHYGGIPGAKLAQALVVGGLFAVFWLLLRKLEVRFPWLWLILLFGVSTPFLFRMLMVRTQAAAVLILFTALFAIISRRYRWLLPLAFAFTWLYNGFILMPIFTALYMLSAWLSDRQWVWRPFAYTLIGTAAGLIINPYFPQNIAFILDHLGEKVDLAASIRVGSEWYPYTTGALIENSLGMLLILAVGMLTPSLNKSGRDRAETTLLLAALVTLYMTFESRRFIEYSPAFALLFGAAALGRKHIQWESLLPIFPGRKFVSFALPFIAVLPAVALAAMTITAVRQEIEGVKDADYMAGAAHWLSANTEPGALIFQTDWDDFTYLFYHNTRNTYLVGLDPTYLQVENPTLWNLWVPITQGMVERPSVLIRDTFGASYIVSDTDHMEFARSAENDPDLELVYRDSYSLIWQIRDAQPEN